MKNWMLLLVAATFVLFAAHAVQAADRVSQKNDDIMIGFLNDIWCVKTRSSTVTKHDYTVGDLLSDVRYVQVCKMWGKYHDETSIRYELVSKDEKLADLQAWVSINNELATVTHAESGRLAGIAITFDISEEKKLDQYERCKNIATRRMQRRLNAIALKTSIPATSEFESATS